MKKFSMTLKNYLITSLIIISAMSCDQDFASIGSGIIGSNNITDSVKAYSVISYNKPLGAVQTNTLSSNLLGHFNDLAFGSFTANVVSQIEPTDYAPEFGENIVLDSVVLTIPFFSDLVETDDDGNNTYELDSVFGSMPIKLSIYENNYFLRNFDPDSDTDINDPLKYFSDFTLSDGSTIDEMLNLQGELLYEDTEFLPSADPIVLTEIDEEGETFESATLAPAIRIHLMNPNDTFWQERIFDKGGEPELSNQNNFLNHFRGLYLKAEALTPDGTMMLLDLTSTNTNLTLYYTEDAADEDEDGIPDFADADEDGDGTIDNGTDSDNDGINDLYDVDQTLGDDFNFDGIDDSAELTVSQTFILNFTGNRVNFYDNNLITIPDGDDVNGDEKLFLKGGPGNMAVINLFGGDEEGVSDEFLEFKSNNWLINEARLVFYVDQDVMLNDEPDRIYIYDLENNSPLIDHILDQSVDEELRQKVDHSHVLERVDDDPNGQGIRYKIEITEHINNLFLRDSTNRKLGLVVTSNIRAIDAIDIQDQDEFIRKVVSGAALSPKGTILFGNNTTQADKRLELEIYYSEPNN